MHATNVSRECFDLSYSRGDPRRHRDVILLGAKGTGEGGGVKWRRRGDEKARTEDLFVSIKI